MANFETLIGRLGGHVTRLKDKNARLESILDQIEAAEGVTPPPEEPKPTGVLDPRFSARIDQIPDKPTGLAQPVRPQQ
jgi:hypothetical protein